MNYVFSIGGGGGGSPPRPFLAFRLFAAARIEKWDIFSFIFRFPFFLRNDREENRFIWINFSSFSRRWIEDSKIFQWNIWIVSSLSFKKKIGRVYSILVKKEREKKYFHVHRTLRYILISQKFPCCDREIRYFYPRYLIWHVNVKIQRRRMGILRVMSNNWMLYGLNFCIFTSVVYIYRTSRLLKLIQ